jgi:hypothetical protein
LKKLTYRKIKDSFGKLRACTFRIYLFIKCHVTISALKSATKTMCRQSCVSFVAHCRAWVAGAGLGLPWGLWLLSGG